MKRHDPIMMNDVFSSRMDEICCVYLIWCFKSNKGYVGSAVNLGRRMRKHRSALRGRYHDNKHLQSAFNAYGEYQFAIYMVEDCSKDEVLKREQFWMDKYEAIDRSLGYNSCPVAGSRLGSKLSNEQRINLKVAINAAYKRNPDAWRLGGEKRKGRKLSREHVEKVVAKCSKSFLFKDPSGIIHSGKNVAEFCRNNSLSESAMCQLMKGRQGHNSHKGWSIVT